MKGRGKGMAGIRGQAHPRAKLSDAQVARLRQLSDEGATPTELAQRYQISLGHACRLGRRRVRM